MSLDYFNIKKYLLIFYNLTPNCYDLSGITFYTIENYWVDLRSVYMKTVEFSSHA